MKKKTVLAAFAVILVLALAACSFSSTTTKTETVTDASGKTTTTTSITSNNNGQISVTESVEEVEPTEENKQIVANIAFDNGTGVDIYAMYFSSALDDNWGPNIFADVDPLMDGYQRSYKEAFRYTPDDLLWDIKVADSEGYTVEFKGLNMANAADPENIVILLTHNEEDNTYIAYVE